MSWPDGIEWMDAGHGVRYSLHIEDGVPITLYEKHNCPRLGDNAQGLPLDTPPNNFVSPESKWQVESVQPLTVSPSLLCRACGHHGFLRAGHWEPC